MLVKYFVYVVFFSELFVASQNKNDLAVTAERRDKSVAQLEEIVEKLKKNGFL